MKLFKSILIGVGLLALTVNAQAQTGGTNSIFQAAETYFLSFNPAYGWTTNSSWQLDTGYKQVIGSPAADALKIQYNFESGWEAAGDIEFDGAGSAFNAFTLEGGYALYRHYDTEVDAQIGGGWDFNLGAFKLEPNLTLKKKFSDNTYSFLRVASPYYARHAFSRNPSIEIGFGITF